MVCPFLPLSAQIFKSAWQGEAIYRLLFFAPVNA